MKLCDVLLRLDQGVSHSKGWCACSPQQTTCKFLMCLPVSKSANRPRSEHTHGCSDLSGVIVVFMACKSLLEGCVVDSDRLAHKPWTTMYELQLKQAFIDMQVHHRVTRMQVSVVAVVTQTSVWPSSASSLS